MSTNPVLDYVPEDGLSHDPWGTSMHAFFTVAETLHWRNENWPTEWDFRPSPMLHKNFDEDDYIIRNYGYLGAICIDATVQELLYAGNVLHHYIEILRLYGRDY